MQQEDLLKKVRNFTIGIGIVYILMGVAMIVFQKQFQSFLGILIGLLACAFGVYRLVVYFRNSRTQTLIATDLFIGTIVLLAGIACLVKHDMVLNFVELIFGLLLFAGALVKVQNAIDIHHLGYSNWWILLVLSFVSAVFSVLVIYQPEFVFKIFMTIAGVFMIYDGAANIAAAILANLIMGRIRKGLGPNKVVESTAKEIPEEDVQKTADFSYQAPAFDETAPSASPAETYDASDAPKFDPETGEPLS